MAGQILTAERLRELLHYDPQDGLFRWKVDRGGRNAAKAGDVAGGNFRGYVDIRVDGRLYKAHRLAVLYMTGEWPPADIDHKYGVRHDNRWSEVRPATRSENNQNRRRAQANNKCGLLGVCAHQGGWRARIQVDGKMMHLGVFATPDLAHAAYLKAKARHHEFQTLVSAPQ